MSGQYNNLLAKFSSNFVVLRGRVNQFLEKTHEEPRDEQTVWVGVESLYEILQCQFKLEELFMAECGYSITNTHASCHQEYSQMLEGLLYGQTSSIDIIESFIWILDGWSTIHWQQHDRALWTYLRKVLRTNEIERTICLL